MTKIVCITSMNKSYYDNIGKLMIESWSKFWPEDCKLFVYQEGFKIDIFKNVEGLSWEDNCLESHAQFETKINNLDINLNKTTIIKFAKKGYAMIAGMKEIECDLLIWIDADAISYDFFPKEKIESILPNEKLIAFFDTYYQINPNYTQEEYVNKNRIFSTAESGFVIINKNHQNFNDYMSKYIELYNAKEKPSTMDGWYDGNVCASAALDLRHYIEDMSKLRTKNKTQTPINHCWIGQYIRHFKAKIKNNVNISDIRKKLIL